MGAPGLQTTFDISKAFKTLQDSIMGDGAFAIHLVDRHFFAIGIVPANRRVDDAFVVGQHAVYNRPVATRDRVVRKTMTEPVVSLSILWTIPGRSTPLMPESCPLQ